MRVATVEQSSQLARAEHIRNDETARLRSMRSWEGEVHACLSVGTCMNQSGVHEGCRRVSAV